MNGYLIAEEGPLTGLRIQLDEGTEWVLGRDPDVCFQVLEDPMVSRKHVLIQKEDEVFVVENLSLVNPALLNGSPITKPETLQEGDLLEIGGSSLRFTLEDPSFALSTETAHGDEISETPTIFDTTDRLDAFSFTSDAECRWLIKVAGGPNTGAEFSIARGSTHILGKDPHAADIVFQDVSVSKQHARLTCDESNALLIEDLKSRNGIAVNGKIARDPTLLHTQDAVVIGTTKLLIIDTEAPQDTLVTELPVIEETPEEISSESFEEVPQAKSWKATVIPTRHLIIGGVLALLIAVTLGGTLALFNSTPIVMEKLGEPDQINGILTRFPGIQYSYSEKTGKLFILGHVMTEVDYQELSYMLKTLPFVKSIEDTVVIDELVWQNTNAMLMKYPMWRGVYLTSSKPGKFILKGYVESSEQAADLEDWMSTNFSYTDTLTNAVAVEQTLQTSIQTILLEDGFATVTFQLTNGEIIFAGRVPSSRESKFSSVTEKVKALNGIREIKNFVLFTKASQEYIDLSGKYAVTGTSKLGKTNQFVVIGGKILAKDDELDGMKIYQIGQSEVLLEKDGLKFKINYNQQ